MADIRTVTHIHKVNAIWLRAPPAPLTYAEGFLFCMILQRSRSTSPDVRGHHNCSTYLFSFQRTFRRKRLRALGTLAEKCFPRLGSLTLVPAFELCKLFSQLSELSCAPSDGCCGHPSCVV